MAKVTIKELKHYLMDRSSDELIVDISELFKRFEPVEEYYRCRILPDGNEKLLHKYKGIIQNEFFPSRGFGKGRLSVAKKAITDYKKVSTSVEGLADLMLYYVEVGVEFTDTFGDINESFYRSMVEMYSRALNLIFDCDLSDKCEERCEKIVNDTSEIGWCFHDNLSDIHLAFFG